MPILTPSASNGLTSQLAMCCGRWCLSGLCLVLLRSLPPLLSYLHK